MTADLAGMAGQQVTIAGWLHRKRQLKSVTFLIIRDRTGLAQVVADRAGRDRRRRPAARGDRARGRPAR